MQCVCVCVCVCEREREMQCVCVREREMQCVYVRVFSCTSALCNHQTHLNQTHVLFLYLPAYSSYSRKCIWIYIYIYY